MQGKRLLKVQEKYYIVDHGFNQALLDKKDEDWGRLLENIVYNELLRRGYEITVGKVNGYEIDFVCKKPNKKKSMFKFHINIILLLVVLNLHQK